MKTRILLLLGLLLPFVTALGAQTVTLNDSSVVVTSPLRTGINIGSMNYYDNGQILKNLVGAVNPGMEEGTSAQIYALQQNGTTTTFFDYDQYDNVPVNYWAGATFNLVESIIPGPQLGCSTTIASNWGSIPVTSISNTGGITTVITGFNPITAGFATGDSIYIAGNSNSAYNTYQTYTVSTVSSSGYTYAQSGSPGSGTGGTTGTIKNQQFTLSSACAGSTTIGDQVVYSKTVSPTPESAWESGEGGVFSPSLTSATLTSDTTDLCTNCGNQALAVTTTAGTAEFYEYFDVSPAVDYFVLLNGTYQVSFDAKSASGSPALTAQFVRNMTNGCNSGTLTPTLTGTWTHYTYNVTCTETASALTSTSGNADLQFQQTGTGVAYLDNVSVQKTSGQNASNTSIFRDEVWQALVDLKPQTIRYWLNQNAESSDNWTRPDYQRNPTGPTYFTGPAGGAFITPSLQDFLVLVQSVQTAAGVEVDPYIEVPVTFSAIDAANLIEFLSAPSSATGSVYGQRRVNLGQSTPWTSVFPHIYLTFCNECWNTGSFPFQSLGGSGQPSSEVYYYYSSRLRDIIASMRGDSYYQTNTLLGMDLQTAINSSADTAIARAKPDYVEIENYNDGTVGAWTTSLSNGWTGDQARWNSMNEELYLMNTSSTDPSNWYTSVNDYKGQSTCGSAGTAACKIASYEYGEGTISSPGGNTISQAYQDVINAGAGYGTAASYQQLLHQQMYPTAFVPQNIFALTEYSNGAANGNTAKLWGYGVDFGGASSGTNSLAYVPRPGLITAELVNKSIIGSMYSCPITSNVTYNYPGSSSDGTTGTLPALSSVPYLFAFCFENGSSRSIVLVNTDEAASHTLTVAGTNLPSGSVTLRQYAPSAADTLNEAATGTSTAHTSATLASTSSSVTFSTQCPSNVCTLPKNSVTAFDFTVGGPAPNAPLLTGTIQISGNVTIQ